MTWKAPEIVHHEDLIETTDKGDMSWERFHKLVRKKCGKFLAEHGEKGMREIIDNSTRLTYAKRKCKNTDNDEYLDFMQDNVYNKRL